MARPEQIDDLNLETQKRYRKKRWIDYSTPFQDYFYARHILKQKKDIVDGGNGLSFDLQVAGINTYADSGVWANDHVGTGDIFKRAEVPWHMCQASYSYDVYEKAFQGDDAVKIIDVLQGRIHAMWNDYFKQMEIRFWKAAASPTGFNGGNASGFSSGVGGVSRTTYPQLKNGTATYQSVSDDDLLAKINQAVEFSNFKAPHDYAQLDGGEPDYGIYTVFSVKQKCDRLVKAQNDNLGRELWKGRPMIMGVPVEWVPAINHQYLEDQATANPAYDANDPVYGINWKTTKVTFNKGCNQVVGDPIRRAGKHNVRDVFLDSMQQGECRDTRSSFVIRKAA
jgi:hypothetical protein